MKNIDDILRRTALRTLTTLSQDACEQDAAKIEAALLLVSSEEKLDYQELVEKISALKKNIKKAKR
jgi:hypothetical protein